MDKGMGSSKMVVKERGLALLSDPLLNKGTAFSQKERDLLGLNGLLPSHVSTVEQQIRRSYLNFSARRTPIGKYMYLMSLMNRNEILFYQLVSRHTTEMLPLIYTPTVGEAALQYSQLYSNRRGFYLSYPLRDKMEEMIANLANSEIEVMVVTDGERILGLGDQGIGGMTIPVGKLSLYSLFAGIHPAKTLPVFLDVGTNNQELLNDDLYLGWRHERISGKEYDSFIEQFVTAIYKRYPKALLQWEDFGKNNARRLLDRYQKRHLSFNDDIQGTAAVVLAALLAAVKSTKSQLKEQKIAILGAGSAGTGIAEMLVQEMEKEGLSPSAAREKIYLVDIQGLIHFNTKNVDASQKPFAKSHDLLRSWTVHDFEHIKLEEVIANAHPTVLIGVSAQGGAFTQPMIQKMHVHVRRPIIFPLSNPTSKVEATPKELLEWTKGEAIVATGSPFLPVSYEGKSFEIAQCNNVLIFPGVGLGALAAEASQVTNGMFLEAAAALAQTSPALQKEGASLFVSVEEVRKVSQKIALAVAKKAIQEGVSKVSLNTLEQRIHEKAWEPSYPVYA